MAALHSAFKERFENMESTRNQRMSLLQDEKASQKNKSLLLSAKYSNIRFMEQRCLILDHQFASHNFRISSLKSQIDFLDRTYDTFSHQFRDLNDQVDELEQLGMEREKCYVPNCAEMEEFTATTLKFAADFRIKVEELRRRRDELKSICSELQKNKGEVQNLDIQAAELRNSEMLALQKKVANTLETNKRERAELQKQLQSLR